jgi:hypothetical protein
MSNLIFIVSQPRSGSTLLQSLISNNKFTETSSEPWLLLPLLGIYKRNIVNANYNFNWMQDGLNQFIENNIGKENFKQDLKNFILNTYKYLEKENTIYIIDKTPRYYEILDLIPDFFPEAKIIILKRNPLIVLNSIIKTWKQDSIKKLFLFRHDILRGPLLLQNFIDKNKSENILEIHYEDIVNNTHIEIEKIYDWLGLKFDINVLNYSSNKKFTGKFGDQQGMKKYNSATNENIDEWKTLLNHKFWRNFMQGYLFYLGDPFISKYGNYKSLPLPRKSMEFEYFRFHCAGHEFISLKSYLKQKYFELFLGKETREWPYKP